MVLLIRSVVAILFSVLVINLNLSSASTMKFKKATVQVGTKSLVLEIAESNLEQEFGLMFRKKLGENEGMLFVFPDSKIRYFWMKNTLIDLSIAFADESGVIVDILEMKGTKPSDIDLPTYPSSKPAKYALEMNKGWFNKNKIKVGDKITYKK